MNNVRGLTMGRMSNLIDVPAGLNGVAVTDTSIGDVDGEAGFFHYRGHDATELARTHSFEEVWHLVAVGHLPDDAELAAFRAEVARHRVLPASVVPVLGPLATATGPTLGRVRAALSIAADELGLRPLIDIDPDERARQALRVVRRRAGDRRRAAPGEPRPRPARRRRRPRARRRLPPRRHRRDARPGSGARRSSSTSS